MQQYPTWDGMSMGVGSGGMSAPATNSQAGPGAFNGNYGRIGSYGDGDPGMTAQTPSMGPGPQVASQPPAVPPPVVPVTLAAPGFVGRSLSWAKAKALGMPWWMWLAIGAGGMHWYMKRSCACKKRKSVLQESYEDEVEEGDEDDAGPVKTNPRKGQTAARIVGTALGAIARSSLGV